MKNKLIRIARDGARHRPLAVRLEGTAQACHAAHLLSCEATCREAATEIEKLRRALAILLAQAEKKPVFTGSGVDGNLKVVDVRDAGKFVKAIDDARAVLIEAP